MSNQREKFLDNLQTTDKRLEALKQLYPEIFSDGVLNLDKFKDVTGTSDLPEGEDKTPGYYGLYWQGKRAAKQLARKEADGTLEPIEGDGVDEQNTHNIYIEGDNLEVLRILKQSYKGRVKMIYIDPPYNTGEDFIYPDDYKMPVDEYLKITEQIDESGKSLVSNKKTNGAFHTNWLNMMFPRFELAKELLTEDGVIFVSIDDNEAANLKLLCDDVFGEENFVVTFVWEKHKAPKNDNQYVTTNHEYILCYAKNKENFIIKKDSRSEENLKSFKNEDNDPRGPWISGPLLAPTFSPSAVFEIEKPNGEIVLPPKGKCWSFNKEGIAKLFEDNRIWCGKDGKNVPRIKRFLSELPDGVVPRSILFHDVFGGNQKASTDLRNLLEGKIFDFPKPIDLIKYFIEKSNDTQMIVLDFFSGSATTAHATMQLNAEDKGNRKYIMVQLPELCEKNTEAEKAGYKTICEIGKERIRRAGAKILEETKKDKNLFSSENKLDIGFKVYRLNKSNFTRYQAVVGTDINALNKQFEEQTTPLVEGWNAKNVLTEIILRQGFALDCSIEEMNDFPKNKIFKIKDSEGVGSKSITLYVCLDKNIEKESIKALTLNDDEKFICLDIAIDDESYAQLSDKGRIETI